jgi:hypothetical protein
MLLVFFVKILTISNLINPSTLKNEASGGFPAYEYPRWSIILGWCIFAICILPIPLIFVIRYIQQYRKLAAERSVCKIVFFTCLFYLNLIEVTRQLDQQP